jgi:hypothetical protein
MINQYTNGALLECRREDPSSRFFLLTAGWTSGGTVLYLLAPASGPIVLPLCLILPMAWYWHIHGNLYVFDFPPANMALPIAAGYALINASWSPARVEALQFAATLLLIAVCAPMAVATLLRLNHRRAIHAMAVGFYGGFAAVGAFWCFEILGQATIHVRLMAVIPALWPTSSRYIGGELPDFFLNHKMVGLAVLFWPAVLTAAHLVSGRACRRLLICGLLPATIAIAASEHQTSQVALLTSGIVFAAFQMALPAAHRSFAQHGRRHALRLCRSVLRPMPPTFTRRAGCSPALNIESSFGRLPAIACSMPHCWGVEFTPPGWSVSASPSPHILPAPPIGFRYLGIVTMPFCRSGPRREQSAPSYC